MPPKTPPVPRPQRPIRKPTTKPTPPPSSAATATATAASTTPEAAKQEASPETTSTANPNIARKSSLQVVLPLDSAAAVAEENVITTAVDTEEPLAVTETRSEETTVEESAGKTVPEASPAPQKAAPVQQSAVKPVTKAAPVKKAPVQASAGKTVTEASPAPGKKPPVRVVKKVIKKKVLKKDIVAGSDAPGTNPNANPNVSDSNPGAEKIVVIEGENPNPNVSASTIAENPKFDETVANECENPNPNVSGSVEVENPKSDEAVVVVEGENHNGGSSEAQNNGDVEIPSTVTATCLETQDTEMAGEVQNESVAEVEGDEGAKVDAGNALIMSCEMEALERKRKRKTEIFVGGLDKNLKEEDLRKVFEEVGPIVEVRLLINAESGKNKGFAFIKYASSDDAKKALEKFSKVEICGKQCGTAAVEGNDTIFLGNIDRKWRDEDVIKLMQEIGIEKIDTVTVMVDPAKTDCNRGFAFLELETYRDAQIAYKKLQKKDVFGKNHKISVAWAQPLREPDAEEILKVKAVYAEFLPASWDEEKVKDYFKKWGEIDNVTLARNLRPAKRSDFAFVNYTTREAALACIEAFSREILDDDGSKVNIKVSLAKPLPKGKHSKAVPRAISNKVPIEKPKAVRRDLKPNDPRISGKHIRSKYDSSIDNRRAPPTTNIRDGRRASTTSELVQLLREQASWRDPQTGPVSHDYPYSLPVRKRPYSSMEDDPLYADPRGYPRARLENSYPSAGPSYNASRHASSTSLPYYEGSGAGYASGSFYDTREYSLSLQTRGAPRYGNNGPYHRY